MSTVSTPDTALARVKGWLPVAATFATIFLSVAWWGLNAYQAAKKGEPIPTPPVVVAETAPAPRLATARPHRTHEHLVATRLAVRHALKAQGRTWAEIGDALDLLDGPMLDLAVAKASAEKGVAIELPGAKPGAFGDGSFIQAIIDWFKSDDGKAVLAALLKLLLTALGLL